MTSPITALVLVGLLLTVVGLFVAGRLEVVALGVASLFGAGIVQSMGLRSVR